MLSLMEFWPTTFMPLTLLMTLLSILTGLLVGVHSIPPKGKLFLNPWPPPLVGCMMLGCAIESKAQSTSSVKLVKLISKYDVLKPLDWLTWYSIQMICFTSWHPWVTRILNLTQVVQGTVVFGWNGHFWGNRAPGVESQLFLSVSSHLRCTMAKKNSFVWELL